MKDKIFHVISNTHWDREWRFPYQKNRQMLVNMIDSVIEILLSEPDYRAYHLDSQSIVLDDYLEVRPDKRDIITKLVKEKRLLIGPWYILPDEFHVGGENLVRNLLLGHKMCASFGGASKTGYSPFSWGQISQLPQIYSQFGIDVIMFYRGVNSLDSDKAEFIWEGADGTRAITSRFSTMPRYNFYFYIYRPVVHNEGFSDVEYKWERRGVPFHFSDSALHEDDYFVISPADTYYEKNLISSVRAIIEKQVNDFTTPHVIWMEGHDSSGPNVKTARIIKDIKRLMPEINVVHSTLEDYTEGLRKSADAGNLPLVTGERRSAQFDYRSGNLYGYITSARTYLKQKNFEAETWLQRYAEPLNSFAGIYNLDINDTYLDIAWNYLIQNSAHDSIGGCSLDEIHEDMMSRYKQVIEISKGVLDRACKHLVKQMDLSGYGENSIHLWAINTTNYVRDEIVKAYIDVPQDMDLGSVQVKDDSGNPLPLQITAKTDVEPVLEQMIDRPMYFKMKRYETYLQLSDVNPFSLNHVEILPVARPAEGRGKTINKILQGGQYLENEYLKILVNPNGSLSIYDKLTKQRFNDVAYFYDEGEAGHAWVHTSVEPVITTLASKPRITLTEQGSLSATIRIEHTLKIHKDLASRTSKKGGKVEIPVTLSVTLKKNTPYAEFSVEVDNTAESHRLRIMIPTFPKAQASYAEGQFDVVERPVDRIDSKDWVEQPMYDYPMYHFVDVADDKNGAAVFVEGLTEYEVQTDKAKTLAITLFRGFPYIIAPSSVQDYTWQKGSQCLGRHSYRMAFYPHAGNWEEGRVYEQALRFSTPLRLVETGRTNGTLTAGASMISIEPKELVFSCLKKADNGSKNNFVLRLHNPTTRKISGDVHFGFDVQSAQIVTLEEKKVGDVIIDRGSIKISVEPKKIISILLTLP
jgi:hypothetical protein